MRVSILPSIFHKFPQLRVGIVVGNRLEISRVNSELRRVIGDSVDKILNDSNGTKLREHPNIVAWQQAYRLFGTNPKKHKPTAESLLRSVIGGREFPNINSAVDAYLAVELSSLLPIGGYDLSRVEGGILLRTSPGGETFCPLGSLTPEHTYEGEIVYSDSCKVLTRRWNHRDADYTKITEQTRDIILLSEACNDLIKDEDLNNTVKMIVEYERRFCGGEYTTFFLNVENPEVAT